MSLKDEYLEKLKAQLDEWSADIDVLEARAKQAEANARVKYDEQLTILKAKRDEAKAKVAEIHGSTGEAWQELKKSGEEAWEVLKKGFEEARKKFKE